KFFQRRNRRAFFIIKRNCRRPAESRGPCNAGWHFAREATGLNLRQSKLTPGLPRSVRAALETDGDRDAAHPTNVYTSAPASPAAATSCGHIQSVQYHRSLDIFPRPSLGLLYPAFAQITLTDLCARP